MSYRRPGSLSARGCQIVQVADKKYGVGAKKCRCGVIRCDIQPDASVPDVLNYPAFGLGCDLQVTVNLLLR